MIKNVFYFLLFFNILNFAGLLLGKLFLRINVNPLFLSKYSIALGCFLIFYLIGNLYLTIYFYNTEKIYLSLISSVFVCLPFVYGCLSNYKTSKAYINLQILTFLANGIFIWAL